MPSIVNVGSTTVNTNGVSDIITITADLGNANPTSYFLGISTASGVFSLSLTSDGVFVTDGGHTFATRAALGVRYQRRVWLQGGAVHYSLNSETFVKPYSGTPRITQALDGITSAGPIRFAVSVSSYCHTKNYFQTCHIYDPTSPAPKMMGSIPGVMMTITERGAGYTATSARGSSPSQGLPKTQPPPNTTHPSQQTPLPPIQMTMPLDNNLLLLGGLILVGLIGMAVFMR